MEDFIKLKVWHLGMEITDLCFELCASFPKWVDLGFKSQIYRSSSSIPSNIAEGCGRSSQKSKKHFFEIAIGSAYELDTQIEIVFRNKLSDKAELIRKLQDTITEEEKMLHSLINVIEKQIQLVANC